MTAGVMHAAGQQPMTPQTAGMGFANGQKQQMGPTRPQQHQHQHQHQQQQHPYQPQQPPQQQMQVQQQQQQQRQQTSPQMGSAGWSFLGKLDILRAICPPLRSPGQGAAAFEARGPLIVVEGDVPLMLKEVTAVIQKALSISGECAVRTWAENAAAEDGGDDEAVAGKGFASPIARYMARMLRWHKTSEELVRYMTTHPSSNSSSGSGASSERGDDKNHAGPSKEKEREVPREKSSTSEAQQHHHHHRDPNARLLPVAVVSDGYSLTASDKWAATLPITDAYRLDDHWRWVATLWRGIVGADLTVYVKRISAAAAATGDEEQGSNNSVEFANADHSVLVLRMADDGQGRGGMDEKLERRLGFEIMEWVRSGGFKTGVGAGADGGVAASAAAPGPAAGKRPWVSHSS